MFSNTRSISKTLAVSSLALAGFVGCTQNPRNPPPDAAPPPAAASGNLNPQPLPPANPNQRVSPQPPPPAR